MSPLLLLSLLFITASGSSFLPHRAIPTSSLPDLIARTFVSEFNADILTVNETLIAKKISEIFQFLGCTALYDKKGFVAAVVGSKGGPVEMTVESAEFANGWDVRYNATVITGDGPFEAQFYLQIENRDYVLVGGIRQPLCADAIPQSSFDASKLPVLSAANRKKIATDFLSSLKESLDGGNVVKFQNHFSDDLKLIGCNGNINKKMLVNGFPLITEPELVEFILLDTQPNHPFLIFFHAHINGLGPAVKGEFVLDEQHGRYVMHGGNVTNCDDL